LIISCAIVTNLVSSGLIRILIAVWRMSWMRSSASSVLVNDIAKWCETVKSFRRMSPVSEGWKLWRVRTPWLLLKHYSVYEMWCTVSS
jgi:hypothetical protein